jgi:hypothetical protein
MMLLYWLAVGVSCVAVVIVLIGWGYLISLEVAASRVRTARQEMERARAERTPIDAQWGARQSVWGVWHRRISCWAWISRLKNLAI